MTDTDKYLLMQRGGCQGIVSVWLNRFLDQEEFDYPKKMQGPLGSRFVISQLKGEPQRTLR
ncbi:MAG TPA: hypothetical protein VKX41_06125 [Alloacidobacterium sp.]|jgi:hypothetical protein|nr:hypothetical protein [Alloacidobacterium sp.]